VFAKMFAAAQYASVPYVSAHASAGSANLGTALLHLPLGGVVILLSKAIERDQN
jgi:hypothetical protein